MRRRTGYNRPMQLLLALLLVSAATLAYELALMRAFSLTLWHHFAYMVISIALLGFGASGTFLAPFYLLFFVPFFPAATAMGLLVIERARQALRVSFFNLLGSGLGSLLLV